MFKSKNSAEAQVIQWCRDNNKELYETDGYCCWEVSIRDPGFLDNGRQNERFIAYNVDRAGAYQRLWIDIERASWPLTHKPKRIV